jgi:hypothetical protein
MSDAVYQVVHHSTQTDPQAPVKHSDHPNHSLHKQTHQFLSQRPTWIYHAMIRKI